MAGKKGNGFSHSSKQSKISFNPRRGKESAIAEAQKQKQLLQQKLNSEGQLRTEKQEPQSEKLKGNVKITIADEVINGPESHQLLESIEQGSFVTPRFHQEDMSIGDRILRHFDTSIKYGPAMGLTRIQRWQRAKKLGKNPPPHILTILEAASSLPDYKTRYEKSIFGDLQ